MNKTIYMIFLSITGYFTGVSAQYVQKETVSGFSTPVAVFYAEGMPESAIWPIGVTLTRDGATIRHQITSGNGGNPDINSRVSARFIVAPEDLPGKMTWAKASGFEDTGNKENLNADFVNPVAGGCRGLTTGGRQWRLPTMRELMLMYIFQRAIDLISPGNFVMSGTNIGYCSATEYDSANAMWVVFAFSSPNVSSIHSVSFIGKSGSTMNVRCISDY